MTEEKKEDKTRRICQYCKFFKNKPGFCDKESKFTSRKNTCDYFERKRR